VSDLPEPDILHSVQISLVDHLQKLIFHLMTMHKWLDKYNARWLSVPVYHKLTGTIVSNQGVIQRNGMKMKDLRRD
jgi:hypothetical protein